jgi:hypothetical protein
MWKCSNAWVEKSYTLTRISNLDTFNDALSSPLLDPQGVQLCQIAEVVWDLEPLPASSTKRG